MSVLTRVYCKYFSKKIVEYLRGTAYISGFSCFSNMSLANISEGLSFSKTIELSAEASKKYKYKIPRTLLSLIITYFLANYS